MSVPPLYASFWNEFHRETGQGDESRFYEAFYFADSEALANKLAELVLKGTKRATAGAMWWFEAQAKRVPQAGDLSIVTNWSGNPLCVIETRSVEVVPFNEVTAEFARTEGEGDGSLEYWMESHEQYFTRECIASGKEFSKEMLIICERFEVVYRPSTGAE